MASKEKQTLRALLYEIVFESDTYAGKAYNVVSLIFIVASVIVVALESISTLPPEFRIWLLRVEWLFTIIFTIDYVVRIWIVTKKNKYIFSFFGIIDLLSILPTYLGLFFVGAQSLLVIRSLRLLRIFRIFKLTRYVGEGQKLSQAIKSLKGESIQLEGMYPGYEGVYRYPLNMDELP